MVDRFDNNRRGLRPFTDSSPRGRAAEQGKIFQGGNLKGIQRRLNYIKGLGANAIWLSPVLKNRQEKADSYHGYGIQNFLEVDPRFGTLEDLRKARAAKPMLAACTSSWISFSITPATTGLIPGIFLIIILEKLGLPSVSVFGVKTIQQRNFKATTRFGRRNCNGLSATSGAAKSVTGAIPRRRLTAIS